VARPAHLQALTGEDVLKTYTRAQETRGFRSTACSRRTPRPSTSRSSPGLTRGGRSLGLQEGLRHDARRIPRHRDRILFSFSRRKKWSSIRIPPSTSIRTCRSRRRSSRIRTHHGGRATHFSVWYSERTRVDSSLPLANVLAASRRCTGASPPVPYCIVRQDPRGPRLLEYTRPSGDRTADLPGGNGRYRAPADDLLDVLTPRGRAGTSTTR